jgi:hypothetical protein
MRYRTANQGCAEAVQKMKKPRSVTIEDAWKVFLICFRFRKMPEGLVFGHPSDPKLPFD